MQCFDPSTLIADALLVLDDHWIRSDLRSKQDPFDRVFIHRRLHLLLLHPCRHPAHDGRQASVCSRPGGIHLRSFEPLSGHRQPIPIHIENHWIVEELNLHCMMKIRELLCSLNCRLCRTQPSNFALISR